MIRFLSSTIGKVIAGLVLVLIILGTLYYCSGQRARQQAAQSKVDRGQGAAFQNSAADAIQTQSGVNENQAASEDLTRSNRDDILKAEGAGDAVNAAVRDAGLRSLCRRAASRNDPRCRVQPTPSR